MKIYSKEYRDKIFEYSDHYLLVEIYIMLERLLEQKES